MIANRFNPLGKSFAKTAKDYIQDGLIAHWDGIENAGRGKHDLNASEWVNLVDHNNNLKHKYSDELPIWGDNCVVGDGVNRTLTAINPALGLNAMSVEIVLGKSVASGNSWAFMARPLSSTRDYFQATTNTSGGSMNFGSGYFETLRVDGAGTLVLTGDFIADQFQTFCQTFCNGELSKKYTFNNQSSNSIIPSVAISEVTMGGALPWNSNCALKGVLYGVRYYNRVLSAEEIAHNYAIDKERFGI